MDYRKQINCAKVNAYDMVAYLAELGFKPDPKKSRGNNCWYNSPLNPPDTDPSFKVNLQKNTWFDFISWEGGRLVDFGIKYHGCTVEEFLESFATGFSLPPAPKLFTPTSGIIENRTEVLEVGPITSSGLIKYLNERRIDIEVAKQFCQEVRFSIGDKTYYGIGLKNNSGGWSIRNPFMKSGVEPMDFTSIDWGYKKVVNIEGFFNFLSYATIFRGKPEMKTNFCIWNTLGMFQRARSFIELHEEKYLYLDHGKGGDDYTRKALDLNLGYKDKRALYKGYDDLNDWHIKTGGTLKQKRGLHR